LDGQYLEHGAAGFVKSILGLFDVPSTDLVELYQSYERASAIPNMKDQQYFDITKEHILNILVRRKDKDAQRFVKNLV
jgi:hypothetical protein